MRALIGTLVGSGPGFILPFVVASHFGVGRTTDAYVFALSIATFGLTLSVSVLEPNALPLAQAALRRGSAALRSFACRTSVRAACAVGLAALPVAVVGAAVVAGRHSWTSPEQHLAGTLIFIFLALLVATGASSVLASCLYGLDCFLLPTLTQGFRAIVPLAALAFIGASPAAAEWLAAAVIGGELMRIGILATRVWTLSAPLVPGPETGPSLTSLWRAAGPAALGVFVLAANPVIDRAVASQFGPGSVTILDLGEKLFYVPVTIIQSSLVLVAGARWARLSAGQPAELRADFYRSIRRTLILAGGLALLTAAALAVAPILLTSRLGGVPVEHIAIVCLFFVIGIPGAGVWMMCGRLLTITQHTRVLPLMAVAALALNLGGDLIGASLLGVRGIALSSAMTVTANAAIGLLVCTMLLREGSTVPMWLRPRATRESMR